MIKLTNASTPATLMISFAIEVDAETKQKLHQIAERLDIETVTLIRQMIGWSLPEFLDRASHWEAAERIEAAIADLDDLSNEEESACRRVIARLRGGCLKGGVV